MAANFRRTRYLVILALGTSIFLHVRPVASAQQSDQGAPQTAQTPQSSQGAPVTAPAAQDPAKTAQPAKTPPKKTPRFVPKKNREKTYPYDRQGRFG